MKFEPIPLRCECGCRPIRIRNVGFTPEGQLVVYWRCLACRRTMYVVKDAAGCWEEAMARMRASGTEAEQESDRRFLASLGIAP